MSQNRKLTSLVSVFGLVALTGSLVAACGDDGDGGGGSCTELSARVEGLSVSAEALTDLAGDIKVDVAGACARIAGMTAPTDPSDEQVTELCNAATATLDAALTAQVSVVIVPPVCTVNAMAQLSCEADCYAEANVQCDPGSVQVRCDPGELSVQCEGSCNVNAYCEGSAEVAVDCQGRCEGSCEGTCTGRCEGTCEGTCMGTTGEGGRCEGTCMGTCTGSCDANCMGECRGSCQVTAMGGVECGAEAKCRGGCTGTATAPSCQGELEPPACEAEANVDCSADCSGAASLDATCTEASVEIIGLADTMLAGRIEAELPTILAVAQQGEVALTTVGRITADVGSVANRLPSCALEISGSVVGAFTGAVAATVEASASVSVSFQASASVSASASGG